MHAVGELAAQDRLPLLVRFMIPKKVSSQAFRYDRALQLNVLTGENPVPVVETALGIEGIKTHKIVGAED